MRSKLSCQHEVAEKIGRELQTLYNGVLHEPLPDRFCELLDRLERRKTPVEKPLETARKANSAKIRLRRSELVPTF